MQVGSPRLGLGFVEVVSKSVGCDVTAVRARDDEGCRLFAPARFVYEFAELWGTGWVVLLVAVFVSFKPPCSSAE